MSPVPSAGKRVRASHDWFRFCFSLVEKVARVLLTDHKAQYAKQTKREITFDAQLNTALLLLFSAIFLNFSGA